MEVQFITSSPDLESRPELILPEFAFIGRSNCGKSSLINHFLDRKKIAKISGKPGKTRLLNYFMVDERYYLVDLPGYGFAKVSKDMRARWKNLFKRFLQEEERPLAIFHLLDSRHKPSKEDVEFSKLLQDSGHPFAIAATKIDKVGTKLRSASYQRIIETLGVSAEIPFFPTTAAKRQGRQEMLSWVDALTEAYEEANDEPE